MKNTFERNAGILLILGCFLLVVTMILHPAGGNFQQLLQRTTMIITSHSIALVAIPMCFVGYCGISKSVGSSNIWSILALTVGGFGLIAAMRLQ